ALLLDRHPAARAARPRRSSRVAQNGPEGRFGRIEPPLAGSKRADLEHLIEELPHEGRVVGDERAVAATQIVGHLPWRRQRLRGNDERTERSALRVMEEREKVVLELLDLLLRLEPQEDADLLHELVFVERLRHIVIRAGP